MTDESESSTIGGRPLYAQVRDRLLTRISTGAWRPGQLIPNEFELAREMGVSQGTARKALDSLAADNLLVRRQGRGTFVVEHTPSEMLFRFFNLFTPSSDRIGPGSRATRTRLAKATSTERKRLDLPVDSDVIRISRIRTHDDRPFIVETIVLPAHRFPGLDKTAILPNTLYDHFQKHYGITVARGDERLSAENADARTAKTLGVCEGTALLKMDRLMFDLDNRAIEWRVSLCHLDGAYYGVDLR